MRVVLHLGAHRTAMATLERLFSSTGDATGAHAGGLAHWGPEQVRAGLFDGPRGRRAGHPSRQGDRPANRITLRAGMPVRVGARLLFASAPEAMAPLRQIARERALHPDAGARLARPARGLAVHDLMLGVAMRGSGAFWASVQGWGMPRGGPPPLPAMWDRLVNRPRRRRHVIADCAQSVPQARIKAWTHEAMAGCPADLVARLTGAHLPLGGGWCKRTPPLSERRGYLHDISGDLAVARDSAGRFMSFDTHQRAALRNQYAEDLAWLGAEADGPVDYIHHDDQDDAAGARTRGPTGPGKQRGPTDDGQHARRLA